MNKDIKIEKIQNYIFQFMDRIKNNNLIKLIKNNPDKDWNYSYLSENLNITWEIVRDNPGKPWSWFYLATNPNLTWEIVRDNPDKDWHYGYLSENPNITWEIVRDNLDKPWDWEYLSNNMFLYKKIVNFKNKTKDIKLRYSYLKNIQEKVSAFSRNIDKVILKRINYK